MKSESFKLIKAETLNLNGSKIYYESYGKGEPLLLLHGYTMSSKSWHSYIADYADDFELYLVDLKGHGKSGMFTEKLTVKSAAEEIGFLADYLKLDTIRAIGFSYGGEVLFQLALLHPGLIHSMITIGTCGSWNAKDFPEFVDYLSYKNLRFLSWIKEQQTSDEQIRVILDQFTNYEVFVSDEELKSIQANTLIVAGDQDKAVSFDCINRVKNNLPKSNVWIVPDTGHGAHMDKNKSEFVRVSKNFLKS